LDREIAPQPPAVGERSEEEVWQERKFHIYFLSIDIKNHNPHMTRDNIKSKRSYGRKKRTTARRRARVPRAMSSTHAVFPFSRSYLLKTNTAGKLAGVLAVGNVQLCGMDHYTTSGGTAVATTVLPAEASANGFDIASKWPVQLATLSSIYASARVVKHEVSLIPICGAGASNAVPLLVSYTKFGIDGSTPGDATYTSALALQDYLSNSPGSKLMSPSHERMPGVQRTFYPSKGSISDNSEFMLPASQSSQVLNTTTADTHGGRTIGFFKIFAEDCGEKDANGAYVQTAVYRVIERIYLSCANRRAV
jgi:hypothetical protein